MDNSIRPGNVNRGWNDPPEFLHSEEKGLPVSTKKTALNKRVSHSLDGSQKIDQNFVTEKLIIPPSSVPPMTVPAATLSEVEIIHKAESSQTHYSLNEIEAFLNSKVQYCKENNLSVSKNFKIN